MLEISVELKKKFVKDFNLPITIFEEPIFSNRIELFEKTHNSLTEIAKKSPASKRSVGGAMNSFI